MSFFFDRKKQLRKTITGIIILVLLHGNVCIAQDAKTDSATVIDTATNTVDIISNRAVPDSVHHAYQKDKTFAYANDPSYWAKEEVKPENSFFNFRWAGTKWFRTLLFVLLTSTLLFALYKILVENKLNLFYSISRKNEIKQGDENGVTDENLEEKISEFIYTGNFRSALRYMYLKALKTLGDKGLIQFNAQGTNHEYVDQLINHPQQKNFRLLTYAYEYVWYGGFDIRREQFESLQYQFENFYKSIGS